MNANDTLDEIRKKTDFYYSKEKLYRQERLPNFSNQNISIWTTANKQIEDNDDDKRWR